MELRRVQFFFCDDCIGSCNGCGGTFCIFDCMGGHPCVFDERVCAASFTNILIPAAKVKETKPLMNHACGVNAMTSVSFYALESAGLISIISAFVYNFELMRKRYHNVTYWKQHYPEFGDNLQTRFNEE